MKALTLVVLLLTTATYAGPPPPPPPPPPPGGTNSPPKTNNLPPYSYEPRVPEHGVIHTTDLDVIEWWNFNNHLFTVEHRLLLTDGSWTNIGTGFRDYEHNYPVGFYRVIEHDRDAVFRVWNSGTDDMQWEASTESPYVTALECYNTNLIPEWGEGYLVVKTSAPADTEIVIQIDSYWDGVFDESKQVTVVVK